MTAPPGDPAFRAPPPPAGLAPGPRPTFSVLIPAYEAAATIGEAIDSLLEQTVPPAEIIVCDDGSRDDLAGALARFGERITLIAGEHRGVAASRNRLLGAARAEFVVPLDADDTYARTRVERLGDLARARPDLDLLATDATFVLDGRATGRFNEASLFATERQAEAILDRCFLICPAMRRERLLAAGGYDESLRTAEDWDICARLVLDGAVAGLVDEPLMEYRLRAAGATADRAETLRDRLRMLEKVLARPGLDPPLRRAAESAFARHRARALAQAAREAVAGGDPDARSRLLAVARCREAGPRARGGALLACLAPHRLRRLVAATVPGSTGAHREDQGGSRQR